MQCHAEECAGDRHRKTRRTVASSGSCSQVRPQSLMAGRSTKDVWGNPVHLSCSRFIRGTTVGAQCRVASGKPKEGLACLSSECQSSVYVGISQRRYSPLGGEGGVAARRSREDVGRGVCERLASGPRHGTPNDCQLSKTHNAHDAPCPSSRRVRSVDAPVGSAVTQTERCVR